jgi:hypothetical protein
MITTVEEVAREQSSLRDLLGRAVRPMLVVGLGLQLVSMAGKGGAFFLYAGLGVLALLFFAWKVPETRGRSLEQIEEELVDEADQGLARERDEPVEQRDRPRERTAG